MQMLLQCTLFGMAPRIHTPAGPAQQRDNVCESTRCGRTHLVRAAADMAACVGAVAGPAQESVVGGGYQAC